MAQTGLIPNPIIIKQTPPRAPIYGVAIDKNNSNPETSVSYINDAVGLLPSKGNNGSFQDNGWYGRFPFNKIKPVLLKDGVEVGDLDPNNYARWRDGYTTQLGSMPLMSVIKIKEDGVDQEFYVVRHDAYASGRTLLLRRHTHSPQKWRASGVNNYEYGALDVWLNNTYLDSIDADIRAQIEQVKIPYTIGNGNNAVADMWRKVFVLSGTELGLSQVNMNIEGEALTCASSLISVTNNSGTQTAQWTRSPNTNSTASAWYITSSGSVTYSVASTSYNARPAFTLPSSFVVGIDMILDPDITTGAMGDVMVKFPYMHYQITQDNNFYYVRYSEEAFAGSTDWAFDYGGVIKPQFYVGAYHGWVDGNNKLRSLSGKTPTVSQPIGTLRTRAQSNGVGYEQLAWNKLILLQVLYIVRYKSLDSQAALGLGYTNANTTTIATGGTNAKGMDFGETTGKLQMKFCGIEDFWGNAFSWIDGIIQVSGSVRTATSGFNDAGTGYVQRDIYSTSVGNFITRVQGTNSLGFLVTVAGGSQTTYFCDQGQYMVSGSILVPRFGGTYNSAYSAGAYMLYLNNGVADAAVNYDSRLCMY